MKSSMSSMRSLEDEVTVVLESVVMSGNTRASVSGCWERVESTVVIVRELWQRYESLVLKHTPVSLHCVLPKQCQTIATLLAMVNIDWI